MKVLLINPPGFGDLSGQGVNVGLGYLASAVQKAGQDVRILDLNTPLKIPNSHRIDSCINWQPDMVGLSINSFNVLSAVKISKQIKARLPEATFWAGGPHITITKGDFLKKYSCIFDGLVLGEGDLTIMELLYALSNSWLDNLNSISGLVIKTKSGELLNTPPREFVKDLDTLPIPNYEVFDSFPQAATDWYNLLTSRGCPYKCVFCASKEIWQQRWRYRSIENINMELLEVRNKYGVKRIRIVDDNFCLKKGRAVNILNLLSSHGFEISLTNGIRADTVDEELVKMLRKNKVSPVVIGVENADPDTFEYVSKGESLAEIEQALKLLRANGIFVIATMIIGLIKTTTVSTNRSIQFLKRIGVEGHWMIALPFPGTKLFNWAHENGRLLYDYSRFAGEGITQSMVSFPPPVCFDTTEYQAAQRLEDYKRANLITGNYYFLYNESEPLFRIIARLIFMIIKYDIKRIGIHALGIAKVFLLLLSVKWVRRKNGIEF